MKRRRFLNGIFYSGTGSLLVSDGSGVLLKYGCSSASFAVILSFGLSFIIFSSKLTASLLAAAKVSFRGVTPPSPPDHLRPRTHRGRRVWFGQFSCDEGEERSDEQ